VILSSSQIESAAMLVYIIPFIFFGIFTQAMIIPDNIKQQLVRLNTTINDRSCSFYTELEKLMPCGSDGYALNFAYHYCQVYLNDRDDFSDKTWQDATRRCLQMKLYEYVTKQQDYPSCENLEEFGFNSHPQCYEKPDETRPRITFCDIPFMDKVKIGWKAAGGPLMEIFRSAAALNFCL
jgi:hypothetical protein